MAKEITGKIKLQKDCPGIRIVHAVPILIRNFGRYVHSVCRSSGKLFDISPESMVRAVGI